MCLCEFLLSRHQFCPPFLVNQYRFSDQSLANNVALAWLHSPLLDRYLRLRRSGPSTRRRFFVTTTFVLSRESTTPCGQNPLFDCVSASSSLLSFGEQYRLPSQQRYFESVSSIGFGQSIPCPMIPSRRPTSTQEVPVRNVFSPVGFSVGSAQVLSSSEFSPRSPPPRSPFPSLSPSS